ncbi:DUF6221 family protein [Micromonospora tulbaghiae]|uniref:DUF6221 family protein n=1 Tax=Micromonospora tulbaghiae TaxID=479978 RepID=UPI0033FC9A4E
MDDLTGWLGRQIENQRHRANALKALAVALPAEAAAYVAETADLLHADADSKQRILDAGRPREPYELPGEYIRFGDWQSCSDSCPGDVWHEVVKLLAVPHAGQPGFRPEWRPDRGPNYRATPG